MNAEFLKVLVADILKHPLRYNWTLQGFGMLRTHLPNDARLNIWDSRYMAVPKPSMIHDHPWDFDSVVVCGLLTNRRYKVLEDRGNLDPTTHGVDLYTELTIKPGIGTEKRGTRCVILLPRPEEFYKEGMSYRQYHDEVHETDYEDGTITLNLRNRGNRDDVARVYYPAGTEWQTAEPRPATVAEILDITRLSVQKFFA